MWVRVEEGSLSRASSGASGMRQRWGSQIDVVRGPHCAQSDARHAGGLVQRSRGDTGVRALSSLTESVAPSLPRRRVRTLRSLTRPASAHSESQTRTWPVRPPAACVDARNVACHDNDACPPPADASGLRARGMSAAEDSRLQFVQGSMRSASPVVGRTSRSHRVTCSQGPQH